MDKLMMGGRTMSTGKILMAVLSCSVGAAIGWWAMKASCLISFLLGPLQHLGLAISRLDNADEYLDGVSRVSASDYWLASLQGVLWLVGVGVVFLWFKGCSKSVVAITVCGWFVVGAINIYLFAIRSV